MENGLIKLGIVKGYEYSGNGSVRKMFRDEVSEYKLSYTRTIHEDTTINSAVIFKPKRTSKCTFDIEVLYNPSKEVINQLRVIELLDSIFKEMKEDGIIEDWIEEPVS